MSRSQIKIIVNFEIINYSEFVSIAKESIHYCRKYEPNTLVYDWYVDQENKYGRLIEVYSDVEAFRAHVTGRIFSDIGPKYKGVVHWLSLQAFGELPHEFDHILKAVPSVLWPEPLLAL